MNRRHITAYRVQAGSFVRFCHTEHHAEQFARALRLHDPLTGAEVKVEPVRLPDDALTRITLGL